MTKVALSGAGGTVASILRKGLRFQGGQLITIDYTEPTT